MTDEMLSAMLVLIVPQIVKEIIDNENISEFEATESLYDSALYSALEREETKLWHLSPKALYELYLQEKNTGFINFPEEA